MLFAGMPPIHTETGGIMEFFGNLWNGAKKIASNIAHAVSGQGGAGDNTSGNGVPSSDAAWQPSGSATWDGHAIIQNQSTIDFYRAWSHYLTPQWYLIPLAFDWLFSIVMQGLYRLAYAAESVFNLSFQMIGLAGDQFNDTESISYTFFNAFQKLGLVVAGGMVVFYAIKQITKSEMKYKETFLNVLYVVVVVAALPGAINLISHGVQDAVQQAQGVTDPGEGKSAKAPSMAAQPIISNTTDLVYLAKNNFDYLLDKGGTIRNDKAARDADNIAYLQNGFNKGDGADYNVVHTNYTEILGFKNDDMRKILNKNHAHTGDVFNHMLISTEKSGKGGGIDEDYGVQEITSDLGLFSGLDFTVPVYSRYEVNYMAVYIQEIILIIIFLSMSIKVVKSTLDIITLTIIAPWVGLRNINTTGKFKELLSAIEGAFASIIMNVVVLKIMYMIMQSAPAVVEPTDVDIFTKTLFYIVVYLGAFFGAFQGIGFIERFTGVSQGHSANLGQMMGAAALGMGAAKMCGAGVKGAAKGAAKVGRGVGKGIGKVGKGIGNGGIAKGLGKAAGAVTHPGATAKAGLSKAGNAVKNGAAKVGNGISNVANKNKQSFKAGMDSMPKPEDASKQEQQDTPYIDPNSEIGNNTDDSNNNNDLDNNDNKNNPPISDTDTSTSDTNDDKNDGNQTPDPEKNNIDAKGIGGNGKGGEGKGSKVDKTDSKNPDKSNNPSQLNNSNDQSKNDNSKDVTKPHDKADGIKDNSKTQETNGNGPQSPTQKPDGAKEITKSHATEGGLQDNNQQDTSVGNENNSNNSSQSQESSDVGSESVTSGSDTSTEDGIQESSGSGEVQNDTPETPTTSNSESATVEESGTPETSTTPSTNNNTTTTPSSSNSNSSTTTKAPDRQQKVPNTNNNGNNNNKPPYHKGGGNGSFSSAMNTMNNATQQMINSSSESHIKGPEISDKDL